MGDKDIVITSAFRTPIGSFLGSLSNHSAVQLGTEVIKKCIEHSKLENSDVDMVYMGQVLQTGLGQNPARQSLINSGIHNSKSASTINQVCGSGLAAVGLGFNALKLNDAKVVIAGGQESMTNSSEQMMLKDGLIDAYNDYHMGITAENVADKWNISREEQDSFAASSQLKAQEAIKNKKFRDEIIDELTEDEHPRKDVTIEKLSKLNPAFKKNGTVTAGNSSGINDGSAAIQLMSREESDKKGLAPLAKIVSWATCGVDPALMGSGPIPASKKALEKAGWDINSLDLVESNEAFAAQSLAVIKELKIPIEKVNVNGGAIALGHPIGASGTRIVVTLIHEMIKRNAKKGLATLCIGGGMGIAMCIERD